MAVTPARIGRHSTPGLYKGKAPHAASSMGPKIIHHYIMLRTTRYTDLHNGRAVLPSDRSLSFKPANHCGERLCHFGIDSLGLFLTILSSNLTKKSNAILIVTGAVRRSIYEQAQV